MRSSKVRQSEILFRPRYPAAHGDARGMDTVSASPETSGCHQ